MKKGQKDKYNKPYFQPDHTGIATGYWMNPLHQKNAKKACKKKNKKKSG